MRLWLVFMMLMILLASVCGAGGPKIHVDKAGLDFGAAYDDAPVEHCLLIENRGGEDLHISRIDTGWGGGLSCLLETNSIYPGGSALLAVTLDVGMGEVAVSRNVVLHTDDPENRLFDLAISGSVIPRFTVTPKSVLFGVLARTTAATQSVRIAANTVLRRKLSAVSVDSPGFAATLARGESEGTYDLLVCTVPPLADGLTRGEVTVSSGDPADAACVVRTSVYVRPEFCVLPDQLVFKSVDEEQLRLVFVRQNGAKAVRVKDVVAPAGFNCEISAGPGRDDCRIYVRARRLSGRSGMTGSLVIKTDDSARPEFPVSVEVR